MFLCSAPNLKCITSAHSWIVDIENRTRANRDDEGRIELAKQYALDPPFLTLGSRSQLGSPSVFPGVANTSKYQTWSILNSQMFLAYTYTTKLVGSWSCLEMHDWGRLKKRFGTTALDSAYTHINHCASKYKLDLAFFFKYIQKTVLFLV